MNNTPQKTPNRPTNGQQRPTQNGQKPPQSAQKPIQNGQRPTQGQQRPTQIGQRPMPNGQRPMQGQQRPMPNGQRPTPNGQRPMRTVPVSEQRGANGGDFSAKNIMAIAIIITAIFLVIAITIGAVALVASGVFEDLFDKPHQVETTDDEPDDKPGKDTQKVDENDPSIVASSITLPASTPAGSYLSGYASDAKSIDGIQSQAAVLVDVSQGKVTASKAADTRVYPASMTKVMTLLVACENANTAGKLLTVEQWMIDYQQRMGASGIMGFKAGEQIRLEDALYLINYNSDTIACLLVANHVAGSEEAFVALMNKKAQQLGLTGTHFTNTTGLHDANHYTTCREMAAIMNCAMNNPIASKIITAHSGRGIAVYTNNKASRSATVYAAWYSDSSRFADDARVAGTSGNMVVIGGKTGYEDIPTACFVTVAENKNGSRYICVTVGRTAENQGAVSAKQSTTDTEAIYKNYAYNNSAAVPDGWQTVSGNLYLGMNVILRSAPNEYDSSKTNVKLPFGTALTRVRTNGKWEEVSYNGTLYYVKAIYTTTTGDNFTFTEDTEKPALTLNTETANNVCFYKTPFYCDDTEANFGNMLCKSGIKASHLSEGYTLTKLGVSANGKWVKVSFVGTVTISANNTATYTAENPGVFYIQVLAFTRGDVIGGGITSGNNNNNADGDFVS